MTKAVKPTPSDEPIKLVGKLVSDDTSTDRVTGYFKKDSTSGALDVIGGGMRVSVLVKDPHTGEVVRLDDVPVKTSGSSSMVSGLKPNQSMSIEAPSYKIFRMKLVDTMVAIPGAEDPVVQNQSIPSPVKIKDNVESFSNNLSSTCKKFNENEEMAKRHMGLTYERDDISIFQGKQSGRSPGVLVHQQDGKLYLFDSTSKQYMTFTPEGMQFKGSSVDIGTADEERKTFAYMGLDQKENKVNDVVPQGTILTPQPKTVPNIAKVLNTILSITDMIDLVSVCASAVKEFDDTGNATKATKRANQTTLENWLMNEDKPMNE
jgi:hypothetical protein